MLFVIYLSSGNAETLGTELLESLLKMAPTKEEERRLQEYNDDSPVKLGQAEKFLKAVIDIPFAFKRVEVMLYAANFESEIEYLKKSFETLEVNHSCHLLSFLAKTSDSSCCFWYDMRYECDILFFARIAQEDLN